MRIVNGKEAEVLGILREFGLCDYEGRMYFSLLTIGESKVGELARKASVPNSKSYDTLERLATKGFVRMNCEHRPKTYEAKPLENVYNMAVEQRQKEIARLGYDKERLGRIVEAIAPIYEREDGHLRLFTPSYQRLKREVV